VWLVCFAVKKERGAVRRPRPTKADAPAVRPYQKICVNQRHLRMKLLSPLLGLMTVLHHAHGETVGYCLLGFQPYATFASICEISG